MVCTFTAKVEHSKGLDYRATYSETIVGIYCLFVYKVSRLSLPQYQALTRQVVPSSEQRSPFVYAESLRWLNEDLVLKQRVLNLEHDLSNGYLLGEILHVHNHQRNFHLFQVRAPCSCFDELTSTTGGRFPKFWVRDFAIVQLTVYSFYIRTYVYTPYSMQ